jgi:DNA repair exonuclease SbcCD nuclease subunit
MKILFFSDLHLHNHQPFHTIMPSGRNSRLQDGLNVLSEISAYCCWNDIDYVIFAGDLFENWRSLDIDVLNCAYEGILNIRRSCKEFFLLVGNHDQYSNTGNVITLAPFRHSCEVIWQAEKREVGDIKIFFNPFKEDVRKFKKYISDVNCADLMVFHQPIKEALLPGTNMPLNKGVSVEDLQVGKFRMCIGGDVHKRQTLMNCVHYLGSPMQLDFSEAGEKKGFTVLYTEDWSLEFVEVTCAPRFFYFQSIDEYESRKDEVRKQMDFVKIRCSQEEGELVKKEITHLKIIPIIQDVKRVQRIKEETSDLEILKEYVKLNKGELEEERLLMLGGDFLEGD